LDVFAKMNCSVHFRVFPSQTQATLITVGREALQAVIEAVKTSQNEWEAGVSSEDSFINEVSEEVRRDRLYALMRRYGWIAISAIVLLVGGAAYNEWRKATERASAEALGDAVLSALELEDPQARVAAVQALVAEGNGDAVLAMIAAAEAAQGDDRSDAIDRLRAVAQDPGIDPLYRDLAALKSVMLEGSEASNDDRLARLLPLTAPGAPYRPLALEAMALTHIDDGDTDTALEVLNEILADGETTEGLRRRASQLIVALGGALSAS